MLIKRLTIALLLGVSVHALSSDTRAMQPQQQSQQAKIQTGLSSEEFQKRKSAIAELTKTNSSQSQQGQKSKVGTQNVSQNQNKGNVSSPSPSASKIDQHARGSQSNTSKPNPNKDSSLSAVPTQQKSMPKAQALGQNKQANKSQVQGRGRTQQNPANHQRNPVHNQRAQQGQQASNTKGQLTIINNNVNQNIGLHVLFKVIAKQTNTARIVYQENKVFKAAQGRQKPIVGFVPQSVMAKLGSNELAIEVQATSNGKQISGGNMIIHPNDQLEMRIFGGKWTPMVIIDRTNCGVCQPEHGLPPTGQPTKTVSDTPPASKETVQKKNEGFLEEPFWGQEEQPILEQPPSDPSTAVESEALPNPGYTDPNASQGDSIENLSDQSSAFPNDEQSSNIGEPNASQGDGVYDPGATGLDADPYAAENSYDPNNDPNSYDPSQGGDYQNQPFDQGNFDPDYADPSYQPQNYQDQSSDNRRPSRYNDSTPDEQDFTNTEGVQPNSFTEEDGHKPLTGERGSTLSDPEDEDLTATEEDVSKEPITINVGDTSGGRPPPLPPRDEEQTPPAYPPRDQVQPSNNISQGMRRPPYGMTPQSSIMPPPMMPMGMGGPLGVPPGYADPYASNLGFGSPFSGSVTPSYIEEESTYRPSRSQGNWSDDDPGSRYSSSTQDDQDYATQSSELTTPTSTTSSTPADQELDNLDDEATLENQGVTPATSSRRHRGSRGQPSTATASSTIHTCGSDPKCFCICPGDPYFQVALREKKKTTSYPITEYDEKARKEDAELPQDELNPQSVSTTSKPNNLPPVPKSPKVSPWPTVKTGEGRGVWPIGNARGGGVGPGDVGKTRVNQPPGQNAFNNRLQESDTTKRIETVKEEKRKKQNPVKFENPKGKADQQ